MEVHEFIPILRSVLTDNPSTPGKVGHTTAVHVPYSFRTVVCKAVLLKKIEGSPVLWTCEIQCAQHMISMKKLRFSSPLRIAIRRHGPPGSARAQSWVWLLLTQWMFSLSFKQKDSGQEFKARGITGRDSFSSPVLWLPADQFLSCSSASLGT